MVPWCAPGPVCSRVDDGSWRDVFLRLVVVDAAPWIAILISTLSAVFTWMSMRDRRQSEKIIHVARVSVEVNERRDEVTENSWRPLGDDITVRNDGPSAVTIDSIARAYGQKWVVDEQLPVYWDLDFVPHTRLPRRLLPPGEELTVEAPDERSDVGILGPVIILVDTNGRQWQRTEWDWRELVKPSSEGPPPRRHLWFDRRPWLQRLDAGLYRRAQKKVLRHPRRVPWEIRFIDAAWGYRAGVVGDNAFRLPRLASSPTGTVRGGRTVTFPCRGRGLGARWRVRAGSEPGRGQRRTCLGCGGSEL